MTRKSMTILACTAALLLSACAREEAASYTIDGDQNHSLSLLREIYPWSSGWEVKLVTTNSPACLRRHPLLETPETDFRVELFRPEEGVFILRQGDNWYVTEMGQCRFQQFKAPPPAPGGRMGEFVERKGKLVFVDASGNVAKPVPIVR